MGGYIYIYRIELFINNNIICRKEKKGKKVFRYIKAIAKNQVVSHSCIRSMNPSR